MNIVGAFVSVFCRAALLMLLLLMALMGSAYAQSEHGLPKPGYEHPGGSKRINHCAATLDSHMRTCSVMPQHSESQIGAQILCRSDAWQHYFKCSATRPLRSDAS